MNIGDAYGQRGNGARSSGGGRRPDFVVKVGIKGEKYHQRCGAAWKLAKGGIAIKIDPGLALVSGTDVVVTLWPNEQPQPQTDNRSQDDNDQIPY
jgi:hypothetical protein